MSETLKNQVDADKNLAAQSTERADEASDTGVECLLPCPFCGAAPEVEFQDGFLDVACFNVACAVQPRALGLEGDSSRESWNTRFPKNNEN